MADTVMYARRNLVPWEGEVLHALLGITSPTASMAIISEMKLPSCLPCAERLCSSLVKRPFAGKGNTKKPRLPPWVHLTPVASYCFQNSEVLSSEMQMDSKLINRYEIFSQIISKDNVHTYIQHYLCIYVCYLWLLTATALCCANPTECSDSCRSSGCWRCSMWKSLDTNWKSSGFWLVGGVFWFSVGRVCLFFLEIALSLINIKAQKTY